MKKTLITIGTVVMLSSTAVMADKGSNKMFKRLDLSPEQTTQMETLNQSHRAEMRDLRDAHLAQVRELLTPEQLTQFDEMVAKRKAKMEKRMAKYDR